jgi:cadherin 23
LYNDRSSLIEVFIQVLDENDNNPYFVTDITNVTVLENAKVGTEVALIAARDPDNGDYGKVTYLLDRMSSQVYNIIKYKQKINTKYTIDAILSN